ncbi:MAG: hypothetical protein RLZZ561_1638 [Pseudomonadota bacterium]|jgi:hypothetical protein
MQFLASLFFATILGAAVFLIRNMLIESSDRIEAALAGEYRLLKTRTALPYRARRQRVTSILSVRAESRRLAA